MDKRLNWQYRVASFGADDWCIIDTNEEPSEHNYYGMVVYGFPSEADAKRECMLYNTILNCGLLRRAG
jgi:hypothetical protein